MATIMVPLDGSPRALEAIPHALSLARRLQAEILLLGVKQEPSVFEIGGQHFDEWRQHEAGLESLSQRLHEAGWKTGVVCLTGEPADQILHHASEMGAVAIVMSSHGRSRITRWLLGSVTDRVVRHATCPTLIVRCPLPITPEQAETSLGIATTGALPTYRRILVPLDGTPASERALPAALCLASRDATMVLARVLDFPTPIYGGELPSGWAADIKRQLHSDHRLYLEKKAEGLRERGLGVELSTRRGSPAAEIVDLAQQADLIVMASCSRAWLERALLGGVASRVLHHSPCPVLVLQGDCSTLCQPETLQNARTCQEA